jgi:hypothetical protein
MPYVIPFVCEILMSSRGVVFEILMNSRDVTHRPNVCVNVTNITLYVLLKMQLFADIILHEAYLYRRVRQMFRDTQNEKHVLLYSSTCNYQSFTP